MSASDVALYIIVGVVIGILLVNEYELYSDRRSRKRRWGSKRW